jgi:hypothetical protein
MPRPSRPQREELRAWDAGAETRRAAGHKSEIEYVTGQIDGLHLLV